MSVAAALDHLPALDTLPALKNVPALNNVTALKNVGVQRRTIDEVLEDARAKLNRLTPEEARRAVADGAVLVDIRPAAQRAEHGGPEDAVVIERNVLEWRIDPASDARLPIADYDRQVVVLCQEGYTSSLAAAALQELGIWRATDVIGGWAAW